MKQYEKAAIERLNRAYGQEPRDLYSVYANPGKAKCDRWQDILDRAIAYDGVPTILSYNAQDFTAAIFWWESSSEIPYGMYITKEYRVIVNLSNNNVVIAIGS
jgi:hypothetical protein